jgi:predicted phosphoribosyltransferase
MVLFKDRLQAGRVLATRLAEYADRTDVIVLALPRGGVPIGFEVASALNVPLDVLTVRKLGAPFNAELAIGAIASGGLVHIDEENVAALGVTPRQVEAIIGRERWELERRDRLFRAGRPFPPLAGMQVIVVDDGLATGSTMRAAVMAVRESSPGAVIVAAPVASYEACAMLRDVADRVVCAATPSPFYGVGVWYEDFSQTEDREVLALIEQARTLPTEIGGG